LCIKNAAKQICRVVFVLHYINSKKEEKIETPKMENVNSVSHQLVFFSPFVIGKVLFHFPVKAYSLEKKNEILLLEFMKN